MDAHILLDFGIVVIAAAVISWIFMLLKQPSILAYVLAGVLIGPLYFGFVSDETVIKTLAELGIAFLLFMVGMEMSFSKLKSNGLTAGLIGILQIILTFPLSYLAATYFGFSTIEAIYLGLILTFSSTMVVIKLLSDRKRINTLHGRLAIGILLTQDVVAILALSILGAQQFSAESVAVSILEGVVLVGVGLILSKYGFPQLFSVAAQSKEQLFISAVAVCMGFSLVAFLLGFSIAIGAFIGGLALASTHYSTSIIDRVSSLRDLFAALFFVTLGMQFIFVWELSFLIPLLVFLALVIIVKPIIIMIICRIVGYSKKTAILTGLSLAQISEFSLIIAGIGFSLGHLSQEIFSFTILLAILTITITPYLMKYSDSIYKKCSPYLGWTEKYRFVKVDDNIENGFKEKMKNHVIICGGHESGLELMDDLRKIGCNFVIIDINPEIIKRLVNAEIPCIYGDSTNEEIMEKAGLKEARMVISTIPDIHENISLIKLAKKEGKIIFVTANEEEDALKMYKLGADYVIVPHLFSFEIIGTRLKWLLRGKANLKAMKEGAILKINDQIKVKELKK